MKDFVLGLMMAILSVGGLFVAAHAGHGVAYYGGLLFFVVAVLFVMFLVKTSYDEAREVTPLGELKEFLVQGFATKAGPYLYASPDREAAGQFAVRGIGLGDLKDAVAKGLNDFREMPTHALFIIVIYPLVTLFFARVTAHYDVLPLVFPLLAGYTLIGPLIATGMYELSRRREQDLDYSRRHVFSVLKSPHIRTIVGLGVILMAIYFVWLWAAWEIYNRIFDGVIPESVADFTNLILFTAAGKKLMVVGSGAGFVFATVVFTLSVVSFPMALDRDVSVMTAIMTSIKAVLRNPVTMGIWGFIVAGTLLLGALPFFVGLAFVLPVLGHATWHLYRRVVVR